MFKNSLKMFFTLMLNVGKWFIKSPKTSLLLLILLGSWLGYQRLMQHSELIFKGAPQAQSKLLPATWTKTLNNKAFAVGYSESRCNPLWVAYRLTTLPKNTAVLPRPTRFSTDERTECKIAHNDYQRSGYDRGHLAPNHAISSLYGKQAQLDSFKLSNISPQKPNLNRKVWQRLEAVELEHFTQLYSVVWVMTGAVFDERISRLKSAKQVEIPDAFYKVYAGLDSFARPHLLAFLVPQTVKGNESLDKFVVSVDAVEKATGLDFFHQLDDKTENALEAAVQIEDWKLKEVANTPSRY